MALLVVVVGSLAVLVGGLAGPADAAPVPAPTPAPSSSPLTISLPGLLTVQVDLPVLPKLLGGGRTAAAAAPTTTPATAPVASAAPRRTAAVTRPPAPRETSAVDTGTRSRPAAPAVRARAAPPREQVAAAGAFQGMLHTGLPIWLLVGVVGMCGLGTVLVVRSAGRRASGANRQG